MNKFYRNIFFCMIMFFFSIEGCFAMNNGDYNQCVQSYGRVRDTLHPKDLEASVRNFLQVCGNPNFTPDFEGKVKLNIGPTLCDLVYKKYEKYEGQKKMVVQRDFCIKALKVVTDHVGLPSRSIVNLRKMSYEMKKASDESEKGFAERIKKAIAYEVSEYLRKYFKAEKRPSVGMFATRFLRAPLYNKKKTLLHFAAYFGNDILFRLLVEHFEFLLNVNILDGDKQSPIYSLFEGASLGLWGSRNYDKILKFLLSRPNLKLDLKDDEGKTIRDYVAGIYKDKKTEYERYKGRNRIDTASIDKETFNAFKKLVVYFQKRTAPKKTLKEKLRGFWPRKKSEDILAAEEQWGGWVPVDSEPKAEPGERGAGFGEIAF